MRKIIVEVWFDNEYQTQENNEPRMWVVDVKVQNFYGFLVGMQSATFWFPCKPTRKQVRGCRRKGVKSLTM